MRSQAGNRLVEEVVLWPAGFKVADRAANVRRVRMVWRQRLQQIGTESQFPRANPVSCTDCMMTES
jgi:hypothetical protein